MSRGSQTVLVAFSSLVGLGVGLGGSRLATGSVSSSARANWVLAGSAFGAALGAGIASYASAPKLQLGA